MKPQLTPELKARFFAQYYGLKVKTTEMSDGQMFNTGPKVTARFGSYLVLRSISSITDEEAIEIAKAAANLTTDWNSSPNKKYFYVTRDKKYKGIEVTEKYSYRSVHIDPVDGEITVYNDDSEISESGLQIWGFQLMLSYGICLPFMGYSVEELVQAGWVKLREE